MFEFDVVESEHPEIESTAAIPRAASKATLPNKPFFMCFSFMGAHHPYCHYLHSRVCMFASITRGSKSSGQNMSKQFVPIERAVCI